MPDLNVARSGTYVWKLVSAAPKAAVPPSPPAGVGVVSAPAIASTRL